jgi:hypothetical protein
MRFSRMNKTRAECPGPWILVFHLTFDYKLLYIYFPNFNG